MRGINFRGRVRRGSGGGEGAGYELFSFSLWVEETRREERGDRIDFLHSPSVPEAVAVHCRSFRCLPSPEVSPSQAPEAAAGAEAGGKGGLPLRWQVGEEW